MFTAQQIKPSMRVVDTDGKHIGTVDDVQDGVVELTREGFADELHHFLSLASVMKVSDDVVVVEPGQATTVEAVAGAILYSRRRIPSALSDDPLFGSSGHATGMGGSGIGH